jgi:chitodextrinase
MGNLKKYVFGRSKGVLLNTFIGGVASTINTPSLLATKLQISTSRITLFSVVGNDIQCKIDGTYAMPIGAWENNNITSYRDLDNLVTALNVGAMRSNISLPRIEFNGVITCGDFQTSYSYINDVILPNCTTIANQAFFDSYSTFNQATKRIYVIPRCVNLGSTVGNNQVFTQNGRGLANTTIYANPFLQTNNAGGVDGDLAEAISLGAIVRYVTNFTVPNPVTTLSAGAIYNTAIQLNFTVPSGANAIDYYELYINGVYSKIITTNGQYATGLTINTSYNLTVFAVDIFYNKSVVSNNLVVSTANNAYNEVNFSNYIVASNLQNTADIESSYSLIKGLEENLLWTKIQALYLFKGNTAAQQRFNAKNPLDTNAAFRLTFPNGANFAGGFTGNGTNQFANTNFIPSVNQNVSSNGLTIVVGSNNSVVSIAGEAIEMGSENVNTQSSLIIAKRNNTNFQRATRLNAGLAFQSNINEARGIFTGTRINTVQKLIRNTTLIASAIGNGTLPTLPIYIGALNLNNSVYGASNQRIQIAIIHEGLSDAEVTTLHSIIDISETIAGRKTW